MEFSRKHINVVRTQRKPPLWLFSPGSNNVQLIMVPVRPCNVKGKLRASTFDAQKGVYRCIMVKAVKYKIEFAKNY